MSKRRTTQSSQSADLFLSQDCPGPSSQTSVSLQRRTRNSTLMESQVRSSQAMGSRSISSQAMGSRSISSQDIEAQKDMQLINGVIRYLIMADHSKLPIQKTHIIKNILGGNGKAFRSIIDRVNNQLSEVFGYNLIEVENNKYILVNEIENDLPHLTFLDNHKQVLLYIILVHIFMHGETCKEDILWDFLRQLDIITDNNFLHDYFGDVKQLVTVDFVNQRYLEKTMIDKNDPEQFEFTWGSRARNELSYRSALQFVADIYGCPMKKWKLQYKAMVEDEA